MEGFKEKEVIYQRIVMYLIIECKESKGHSTHGNRPGVEVDAGTTVD